MKIGIVTTHNALNCGAVLQAYASQLFLQKLGHDVFFIDFKAPYKKTVVSCISKSPSKTWYNLQDLLNRRKYLKKNTFNKVLQIGDKHYTSIEELRADPPICDLYYAGSDQIWTISKNKSIERANYLDFGPSNIKRISYAASLGQGHVPKELEAQIKALLLNFDHISVREISGVNAIQRIVGSQKKVHHVIDPTLLITKSDYLPITQNIETATNYIVSYSLAEYESKQKEILAYILKSLDLPLKNLRNPDTCIRVPYAENIIVTPYSWLAYIMNANLVICTSFHAVVFSLIFHKSFVVVSPYENKRIMSLLGLINLKERFIRDFDKENIDQLLNKKIDWNLIDDKLKQSRQSSVDFLLSALD